MMPKRKPGAQAADDINKRFGSRLRRFRELAGRSQSEVGDALGVSFQQIQKYENGTTSISLNRLDELSDFLSVTIAKLIDSVQETKAPAAGFAETAQTPFGEDDEQLLGPGPLTKQKVALLNAFSRIDNSKVRKSLVGLAEAIVSPSKSDDDTGSV